MPDAGKVTSRRDITGMKAHKVASVGMARTFQNIRTFNLLSVLDNVLVGAHPRLRAGVFGSIIKPPAVVKAEKAREKAAIRHLAFFDRPLAERKDDWVTSRNYADRRRVEIARAMMLDPDVLLLDEPAAGMNPAEVEVITAQIKQLRDAGYTVILVEHQMPVVMGVSDRLVVMNKGEVLTEGTPAEIQQHEEVIKAYLGTQTEECEVTGPRRPSLAKGEPMLKLRGVSAAYGAVRVLKGVDIDVYPARSSPVGGECRRQEHHHQDHRGNVRASHGTIEFVGTRPSAAARWTSSRAARPWAEGRRIFWRLTVEENLEMGAFSRNEPELIKRGIARAYERFPHPLRASPAEGRHALRCEQQMLASPARS